MPERNLQSVLESVCDDRIPTRADVEFLLAQGDRDSTRRIMRVADEVRSRYVGDDIVLRGIVEFSNYCQNTCAYCGLNTPSCCKPQLCDFQDLLFLPRNIMV